MVVSQCNLENNLSQVFNSLIFNLLYLLLVKHDLCEGFGLGLLYLVSFLEQAIEASALFPMC